MRRSDCARGAQEDFVPAGRRSRLGLSVLALLLAGAPQLAMAESKVAVDLGAIGSIRYDLAPGAVVFGAQLPAGWTVSVAVDGDQDGIWGHGPYTGADQSTPTSDIEYSTLGALQGVALCAQYVYAANAKDAEKPYYTSYCNVFASKAEVHVSQPDSDGNVTTGYLIPASELFGSNPTAHVVFIVWDTNMFHQFFTISKPFVLNASDLPAAK
jgi:hypothetical protein